MRKCVYVCVLCLFSKSLFDSTSTHKKMEKDNKFEHNKLRK